MITSVKRKALDLTPTQRAAGSAAEPITLLEEIFPQDTNPYGTAFGGKILALMDRAAGLAASRFARAHFVTASLTGVEFQAPVRQGEVAQVVARVVYASRRTCGVLAEVFAVDKTRWDCHPCGRGILFMVAIGPEGKPLSLPTFKPRGKRATREWRSAPPRRTAPAVDADYRSAFRARALASSRSEKIRHSPCCSAWARGSLRNQAAAKFSTGAPSCSR
jgi:acyl-CoA hydrolase